MINEERQPKEVDDLGFEVEPVAETPNEEPIDVLDEETLTLEASKERITEAGKRLKKAGWKPWRDMIGSYVERVVDATLGMAEGFEGKKKSGK